MCLLDNFSLHWLALASRRRRRRAELRHRARRCFGEAPRSRLPCLSGSARQVGASYSRILLPPLASFHHFLLGLFCWCSTTSHAALRPDKLTRAIRLGVPPELREEVWMRCSGAAEKKRCAAPEDRRANLHRTNTPQRDQAPPILCEI